MKPEGTLLLWGARMAVGVVLLFAFSAASAAKISLAWDPVTDDRVGKYVVAWGYNSKANGGTYAYGNTHVPATETRVTTPDIVLPPPGKQKEPGLMFFAVKACTSDGSLCSDWSNEVSAPIMEIPINLRLES